MRFLPLATAEAMPALDPRVTPLRDDLAAKYLEGKVKAARFVEGSGMEVIAPQAPLRREPRPDVPLDTEALKGEHVTVYDTDAEGWAWVQLSADKYVGWLPRGALGSAGAPATHRVAALRTFVFPGPSIKLPPIEALPFGAKLNIVRMQDQMAVASSGFYVPAAHLKPVGENETDFVAVAEWFLGAPYLWGGKNSARARLLRPCAGRADGRGRPCPRDSTCKSKRSARALTKPNGPPPAARRSDILERTCHRHRPRRRKPPHANAFRMAVAAEPIAQALARIRATGAEITSVRRITLA